MQSSLTANKFKLKGTHAEKLQENESKGLRTQSMQ